MKTRSGNSYEVLYPTANASTITGVLPVSKGGTGTTSVDGIKNLLGMRSKVLATVTINKTFYFTRTGTSADDITLAELNVPYQGQGKNPQAILVCLRGGSPSCSVSSSGTYLAIGRGNYPAFQGNCDGKYCETYIFCQSPNVDNYNKQVLRYNYRNVSNGTSLFSVGDLSNNNYIIFHGETNCTVTITNLVASAVGIWFF